MSLVKGSSPTLGPETSSTKSSNDPMSKGLVPAPTPVTWSQVADMPRAGIVFESERDTAVQDIQARRVKDAHLGVPVFLSDGSITERDSVAEAPLGEEASYTSSDSGSHIIREVARLTIVLLALALVLRMAMRKSLPLALWAVNWAYAQLSETLS